MKELPIGAVIRDLRNERRMNQKTLAFDAQLIQAHLSNIENDNKFPTVEVIDKICLALNIPVWHLLAKAAIEKDQPETKRRLYREVEPYFEKFENEVKELYQ